MSVGVALALGLACRPTMPPPPDRTMSPPSTLADWAVVRPSRLITTLEALLLLTAATKTELALVVFCRSSRIDALLGSVTTKSTRSKSPGAFWARRRVKPVAAP